MKPDSWVSGEKYGLSGDGARSKVGALGREMCSVVSEEGDGVHVKWAWSSNSELREGPFEHSMIVSAGRCTV